MKIFTSMKALALAAGMLLFPATIMAEADQDTTVVVPESGCLPIKPSRNFTGPKEVVVCSLFGSNSSGLYFTKYALDTVVVGSSTNSSSGLFLVAKPGTYKLTLTDREVTGKINSTSVSWQNAPGKAYKEGRVLYKFVNTAGNVGFQRDETYAADNYQYCGMAEGEHIYLPLAANNVAKAAELLETTAAELAFIPWAGPWKNVPELSASSQQGTTATFDFQNNNGSWPVGEGADYQLGDVTTLTAGGVTLTGIQGSSANPPRIMKNASRGICLWLYKNTSISLTAPAGKAITKAEFTMQSGSFDLTPSTGSVAENVWTGNASEVTFGPNENSTRYVWAIAVTLADENAETVKPAAYDAEAADIAAFNAVEDGKTVKLTLTNAKVNGVKNGDYYVEDASGATVIKGLTLTAGTALNGYVIGKKSTDASIDMDGQIVEYALTATDASTFEATSTTLTGKVMTGAEAAAQANYGRLITLENVAISGGNNKTLTVDGTALPIKARDYMDVLPADYTWPEKASKITGVLVYYVTGWFLMPISADAIVAAGAQPTSATFDFTSESIRENIGTAMGDTKGYIYNETFTAENVTLQITGGSAPSRIYKDANRGQNLVTYTQYATLTFKSPAGYAVTKIEFTAAGSSNISKLTPSSGAVDGMTWTGNAEGVRFAQGGTSYLAKAVVTLAAKDESTAALPALEYTECANIAAFNALEAGTYAKVTLTDAEITGKSADGYTTVFVQDATGGCWIQYTTLNDKLQEKTKVNGVVYVVKRLTSGNPQMKEAEDTPKSELTATELSDYTVVEGTLAEVNVAANLNKVVKLTGATLEETSATAGKLTQGDATIDVNNGAATANQQLHKVAEWAPGTKLTDVTMVAILVAKSATANQLLPISVTGTASGIETVVSDVNADDVQIYNLQGVRLNSLQRGVNIVNGKKVVIK